MWILLYCIIFFSSKYFEYLKKKIGQTIFSFQNVVVKDTKNSRCIVILLVLDIRLDELIGISHFL